LGFSPCLLLTGKREKPGAKSPDPGWDSTARLKLCPDTKHHRSDYRKNRACTSISVRSHTELSAARYSGFTTYVPLASKPRIPYRQFVSTTEVDYRRTEAIRYKRYRSLSLPSPMTPVTISYRAGHPVSRPARRVGRDHLVLHSLTWLDGFEVGTAAINPAAVLRPGDPDRVDTW
jgi:hypothetical protein